MNFFIIGILFVIQIINQIRLDNKMSVSVAGLPLKRIICLDSVGPVVINPLCEGRDILPYTIGLFRGQVQFRQVNPCFLKY